MLISEMIAQLEQLKEKHGDIQVFCEQSQDCYYEEKMVNRLIYKTNTFYQDGTPDEIEGVYLKNVD